MTEEEIRKEIRASIKKMARDPYVSVYVDFLADRLTENLILEIVKAHMNAVSDLGNWLVEQGAALEATYALAKITHGQSDGEDA